MLVGMESQLLGAALWRGFLRAPRPIEWARLSKGLDPPIILSARDEHARAFVETIANAGADEHRMSRAGFCQHVLHVFGVQPSTLRCSTHSSARHSHREPRRGACLTSCHRCTRGSHAGCRRPRWRCRRPHADMHGWPEALGARGRAGGRAGGARGRGGARGCAGQRGGVRGGRNATPQPNRKGEAIQIQNLPDALNPSRKRSTRQPDRAAQMIADMRQSSVEPDEVTYTTLITGYGFRSERGRALDIFEEVKAKQVPMSGIIYSAVMSVCARVGDKEKTWQIMAEMEAAGCRGASGGVCVGVPYIGWQHLARPRSNFGSSHFGV